MDSIETIGGTELQLDVHWVAGEISRSQTSTLGFSDDWVADGETLTAMSGANSFGWTRGAGGAIDFGPGGCLGTVTGGKDKLCIEAGLGVPDPAGATVVQVPCRNTEMEGGNRAWGTSGQGTNPVLSGRTTPWIVSASPDLAGTTHSTSSIPPSSLDDIGESVLWVLVLAELLFMTWLPK